MHIPTRLYIKLYSNKNKGRFLRNLRLRDSIQYNSFPRNSKQK